MKKNKKTISPKERELRRQKVKAKETLLMYKFLFVTLVMLLGIAVVLAIRNNGMATLNFLMYYQCPLAIATGVLAAAAVVYFIICRKKAVDERTRVVTSTSLLTISLSAFALMLSYGFIDIAYDTSRIIAIIIITALYFVYHIYDSLFFTVSMQCALGVLAFAVLSKVALPLSARAIVAVLAIVACSAGAYFLQKFLSKAEEIKNYKFYITMAMIIAGAFLSLFIPAITSYAVFALLAVYVITAVISTIELM